MSLDELRKGIEDVIQVMVVHSNLYDAKSEDTKRLLKKTNTVGNVFSTPHKICAHSHLGI